MTNQVAKLNFGSLELMSMRMSQSVKNKMTVVFSTDRSIVEYVLPAKLTEDNHRYMVHRGMATQNC